MIARQMPCPFIQGGDSIRRGPDGIGRPRQAFHLRDVREEGAHELRARREMQVDGAPGDACPLGHARHGQGIESLFLDDGPRGREQCHTRTSAASIRGPARHPSHPHV
jgi:hypothetical protein